MNLSTLTCWGYYQILNIGVSLSDSTVLNMYTIATLRSFTVFTKMLSGN